MENATPLNGSADFAPWPNWDRIDQQDSFHGQEKSFPSGLRCGKCHHAGFRNRLMGTHLSGRFRLNSGAAHSRSQRRDRMIFCLHQTRLRSFRNRCIALTIPKLMILAIVASMDTSGIQAKDTQIKFNRDIRPLLSDRCFHCHGPDEEDRKAGLRLDQRGGEQGALSMLSPGDANASELYRRITSSDPDVVMPPPEAHKNLQHGEKRSSGNGSMRAPNTKLSGRSRHWNRPRLRHSLMTNGQLLTLTGL